jgi:hypothetical protein
MLHPVNSHHWRYTFLAKMVRLHFVIPMVVLLTLAASCQECMASEHQEESAEVGDVEMNAPSAASSPEPMASELQDNSAEVADTPITIVSKGKKRRRTSGGHSESLIFIAIYIALSNETFTKQLSQDRQPNRSLLTTMLKQPPVQCQDTQKTIKV